MKKFEMKEIQNAINAMIEQIKQNSDEFTGINDFRYERNDKRIDKPRLNFIRKFCVPTNYSIEFEFMPDAAGRARWVGKELLSTMNYPMLKALKSWYMNGLT